MVSNRNSSGRSAGELSAGRERIVIKLSGSLFSQDSSKELASLASLIIELSQKYQPIVIAGGGKVARNYISTARSFGLDEASLDIMGIEVSRLNAKLLSAAIEGAGGSARRSRTETLVYHSVPRDLEEISAAAASGKIVVTGGLHPGQSTNATSALIAEKVGAVRFVNATDVDGIYSADPRKNPSAKLFSEITISKCLEILGSENASAGSYDLMDIVALKVIERSKIPTVVLKSDVITLRAVLLGGKELGTRIIT